MLFRSKGKYEYQGKKKEIYVYVINSNFKNKIGIFIDSLPRKLTKYRKRKEYFNMMIQKMDYNPEIIDWHGFTDKFIKNIGDEIMSFHNTFKGAFNRGVQRIYGEAYLKGLLSDIERKNVEAICLRYLHTEDVRGFQKYFSYSKWDDLYMKETVKSELSKLINADDGMITVDSSENVKKGNESVGVARQYCGNVGKIENCQSGVFVGYTSSKGYGLLDGTLYMPEIWFTEEYKERKNKCGVPESITFKTKNEIAINIFEKT